MNTNYVVWLTGLSGAGKTTIANRLKEILDSTSHPCIILDGDEIREVFRVIGFDKQSRDYHVLNVGKMASFLQKKGMTVIVSMISPYESVRRQCRFISKNFIEVYVDTPLSVCRGRDVKGLYKKADAGEIKEFTGVSAPYEPPSNPELSINTSGRTPHYCAVEILKQLK